MSLQFIFAYYLFIVIYSSFNLTISSHFFLFIRFFFFFSSRRRHTRCLSDWSSDVCSSDLRDRIPSLEGTIATGFFLQRRASLELSPKTAYRRRHESAYKTKWCRWSCDDARCRNSRSQPGSVDRSEERRVGKECRGGTQEYD